MGFLHDLGEDVGLISGEVGEDFAVQINVGFFEAVDEFAIGKTIEDGTGADLDLPETAGVAFFLSAVFKLKTPRMQERFFGGAVLVLAAPHKPFRMLE